MTSSTRGLSGDDSGFDRAMLELSDAELIDNARAGSTAAFEELWHRHSVFGIVGAEAEVGDHTEQVTADTWQQILQEIQAKQNRPGPFRPYLYSTVHATASQYAPARPDDAGRAMGEAFTSLPPRWQEVLWYHDVERMSTQDIALLTGLKAEEIITIRTRARRGLTEAWMKANLADTDPTCQMVREYGRAYLKKTLPQADMEAIDEHLVDCTNCRTVFATANTMSSHAPRLLLAAMAGTTGGAAIGNYLAVNGPIVINNDPMPRAAGAAFVAETAPIDTAEPVVVEEHFRRSKVAIWIALLIVLALVAALIAVSRLSRTTGGDGDGDVTSTPSVTVTPTPSEEPTPTPTEEPTPTPTEEPSVEPTVEPTEEAPPVEETTAPPPPPPTTQAAPPPTTQAPPPPPPPPAAPAAAIGSVDTGPSGCLSPVISGSARPGDVVTVSVGGATLSTTADASGYWRVGPFSELRPGNLTVTATASSNASPASASFSLASPPYPMISSNSSQTTLTLTGVANSTAQVIFDNGTSKLYNLDGSGKYIGRLDAADLGLPAGPHTVSARYYESGRFGPTSAPMRFTI